MIKVSIIGYGNVAQHLMTAFANNDSTELVQVFSRDASKIVHLISPENITDDYNALAPADLYLISVTDSAIAEVSGKLPFTGRLIAHTSGSMPLEAIDGKNRRGVFYPLQTFTKNKPLNFREIPVCIEAENESDTEILSRIANAVSDQAYHIGAEQRKALHVAAVFANNFTNHMYDIAHTICGENYIPFDILKPLIAETANKVRLLTPAEAQTGPAKRNDEKTIAAHLDFLKDENQRHIYKILTQSITEYGKKL